MGLFDGLARERHRPAELHVVFELDAPIPWTCRVCREPATCIGAYEGSELEEGGCDVHCGHGNEDGHCRPVTSEDVIEDDRPTLVSVCRADGLVELTRHTHLSDIEWFKNDWDGAGDAILDGLLDSDDFRTYRRLVVRGRMFATYSNTADGEDWESGFRVTEIRVGEKRESPLAPT